LALYYCGGNKLDLVLSISNSLFYPPKLFLFLELLAATICFILFDTFAASNSLGF